MKHLLRVLIFSLFLYQLAVLTNDKVNASEPLFGEKPILAGGLYHSYAVKDDGTLRAWGNNNVGQLGDGTVTKRKVIGPVKNVNNAVSVVSGNNHGVALLNDGTLMSWGANNYGQLGDNSTTTRKLAVKVANLTNVVAVAAGSGHNLALKSDGTVWAWGYNNNGQLGDGTTTTRKTPVQVKDLSSVTAIAAGTNVSYAVTTDGKVWAWGQNNYGQIGDGTTTVRKTPVNVPNITDVKAISSVYYTVVALKNDGTVWAWGSNKYGQIGDNTTLTRKTPVQVQNITNAKAVGSGYNHSIALLNDGTVWAWGQNNYGQLGDGTTVTRKLPIKVKDLSGIIQIAAGRNHNLALKSDDTVAVWGYNNYGQLGDGSAVTKKVAVLVSGLTINLPDAPVVEEPDTNPPIDDSLELAEAAVVAAEETANEDLVDQDNLTLALSAYDDAMQLVTELPESTDKNDLMARLDSVKQILDRAQALLDATNAVEAAEQLANGNLSNNALIDAARASYDNAAALVNGLADSVEKTKLIHRLDVVLGKLNEAQSVKDTTPPVTTDDAPTDWIKQDITVHLSVMDNGTGVTTTYYKVDGGSQQVGTTVTLTTEGTHTIVYWSVDQAGNVETEQSKTIKIDKTAPITTDNSSTEWARQDVTVNLSAMDNGSGVAATYYKVDGGSQQVGTTVTLITEGTHTIVYWSIDQAGNVEAEQSKTIKIDKTAPITTDNSSTEWARQDVTVNLSAMDNGSGVAATYYKVDGGSQQVGTTVTLTTEGTHTIVYWSIDQAGNVEAEQSKTIKIDKTAPITTDNSSTEWARQDVTVSLSAMDNGSGVAATYYKVDGGSQQVGTTVTLTTEGTHTIVYWSVDQAGNVEAEHSKIIKIDKTAPVTIVMTSEANGQNGWFLTNPTVTLIAQDNYSGVLQTQYRINGGQWITYTQPIQISSEGTNILEYKSVDKAGNTEVVKSATIKLDKTLPTLNVALDKTTLWPPNHQLITVNATIVASDGSSPLSPAILISITSNEPDNGLGDGDEQNDIQDAQYGTSDTSFKLRAERNGKGNGRVYTITYMVTDQAGNKVTKAVTVTVAHDQSKNNK